MLEEFLETQLNLLEEKGLRRQLRNVQGFQSSRLRVDGRVLLNFCSNNYLGLAGDSRLSQAVVDCLKVEGYGAGASRLVCGNMQSHRALEEKLAEFKGTESCLVFNSGYMANVGIISSLFDHHDIIFSDKLNHASIIDGIQLSGATMKRYPHLDMNTLEDMIKAAEGFQKKAIITDSVFSMDGDIAPLDRLVELAKKHHCILMIDEAHALGVFGDHGKGLAEHFGVSDQIDIHMGTLSKAAGSFGAYCCGSKRLIDFLINKARSFIYTTGLPPGVAAASLKGIEIIEREKQTREKLWENTRYLLAQLKLLGFNVGKTQSPIIPVIVGDEAIAVEFSKKLFLSGIFVSAIRPPTVPPNSSRLRFTAMVQHTKQELDFTVEKCQTIGKELCLI